MVRPCLFPTTASTLRFSSGILGPAAEAVVLEGVVRFHSPEIMPCERRTARIVLPSLASSDVTSSSRTSAFEAETSRSKIPTVSGVRAKALQQAPVSMIMIPVIYHGSHSG